MLAELQDAQKNFADVIVYMKNGQRFEGRVHSVSGGIAKIGHNYPQAATHVVSIEEISSITVVRG